MSARLAAKRPPRRPIPIRLAAAGVTCALAIAILPGLQVAAPATRPAESGSVRDVALGFDQGSRLGRLGAAGRERLNAAQGTAGAWVSQAVDLGAARMLGVSWGSQAGGLGSAELWYRTGAATSWSGWARLEADDAEPDPGSADDQPTDRVFSEPVWLPEGSGAVQLRVEFPGGAAGTVERLAAHLVEPDMRPTQAPGRGGATASPAAPHIITRARWGADERLRRERPAYASGVKVGFVHHTVQTNAYRSADSAAMVRADYVYHTRTRRWSDLGYNFLIDRYGRIFEGRAGGIDRAVIGAHTGGLNTGSFGVALIGEFSSAAVPGPMLAALERLFAWKLDVHHADPQGTTVMRGGGGSTSRYRSGQLVRVRTISGHRDTNFTACPGERAYALLATLRARVARTGLPKIYGGATAARINAATGAKAAVTATFSQPASWSAWATGADARVLRRWSGSGRSTRIVWDGREAGGRMAVPGTATITVTASAGGHATRPMVSPLLVETPLLRPPDGTMLAGPAARVDGGGRWPYAGAAERAADAGPSAPVRLRSAYRSLLGSPRADFADGALLREANGHVWVVSDGQRRQVADHASLTAHGYDALPQARPKAADLARLAVGPPLAAADPLPDGTLLAGGGGSLWRIEDGRARRIDAAARAAWRARTRPVTTAGGVRSAGSYPAGAPLGFPDGTLLRATNDRRVWVIAGGVRRNLVSRAALTRLGYRGRRIAWASPASLRRHPRGPYLTSRSAPPSGALIRTGRTTWLVVGTRRIAMTGGVIASWRTRVNAVTPAVGARLHGPLRSYPGGTWLRSGASLWVVSDGRRRPVAGSLAGGLGSGARRFTAAAFTLLALGPPVTAADRWPDETMWRSGDGRLWRVEGGRRRLVAAAAESSWRPIPAQQVGAAAASFASLRQGPDLGWRDGALVRSSADGRVWAIAGGQRRLVASGLALAQAGLSRAAIVAGSQGTLDLHARGADIALPS